MLALDDAQGTADRTRRDALRLDDVTAKPDAESKEPAVTPVAENKAVTSDHVLNAILLADIQHRCSRRGIDGGPVGSFLVAAATESHRRYRRALRSVQSPA